MTAAERVARYLDSSGYDRDPGPITSAHGESGWVKLDSADLVALLAERDALAARVAEMERARVCDCGRPLGNAVCAVCDNDE